MSKREKEWNIKCWKENTVNEINNEIQKPLLVITGI